MAFELCSPSSIALQEVSERLKHLLVPSAAFLQSRCLSNARHLSSAAGSLVSV